MSSASADFASLAASALPLVTLIAPPVKRQLLEVRSQTPGHVEKRNHRLGRAEEVLEVRVRGIEHHPHEGDRLERRLEAAHVLAQPANVIGRGEDRAADVDAAGRIRVIVRIERGHELHLGLALEELDHFRPVLDKALDRGGIVVAARLAHHVFAHALDGVSRVLLPAIFAQRNPQDPARQRGGTTEHGLLFEHDDIEAALACSDRGGEARGTRSDHDQIASDLLGHIHSPCRYGVMVLTRPGWR